MSNKRAIESGNTKKFSVGDNEPMSNEVILALSSSFIFDLDGLSVARLMTHPDTQDLSKSYLINSTRYSPSQLANELYPQGSLVSGHDSTILKSC